MASVFRLIFPSRLSRIPYSLRLFLCIGVVSLIYYLRGLDDPQADVAMFFVWNYVAFFIVLPRARESGLSFLSAIFALVPLFFPFLAVSLMFRPADRLSLTPSTTTELNGNRAHEINV
jgi:hypothetical protein